MRAFVFIDAENHYLRSVAAVEALVKTENPVQSFARGVNQQTGPLIHPPQTKWSPYGYDPSIQLFWDSTSLARSGAAYQYGPIIHRFYYVCSSTGDSSLIYDQQVLLRNYGFDPIIIHEKKIDLNQRKNSRSEFGLIEKPKGCDIMIATKIISDAAANLYDACLLFSSDSDFIPAIEAIRSMGKLALVFGYKSNLKDRSPYLHVPDRFYNLEEILKRDYQVHESSILTS